MGVILSMRFIKKLRSNMAVNIISAIVLLLVLFGLISSIYGLASFTKAFKKEYSTSTYHMADTAAQQINGDHLDDYLAGEQTEEYLSTRDYLDAYCRNMNVSMIYVILVDQSDYGRFVSVFNAVENAVDDTEYTVWELGHKRDTTNTEYRIKYKALYDQEAPYETVYRQHTVDGQHPHITTMVPVKNAAGETAAILCMQRPIRELDDARRPYLVNIAVSTVLLAIFASVFAVAFIRKMLLDPILRVSAEATRFARENTRGEPLGEISKYREISNLAYSIDTMEKDMVNYIENLTAATAEKERIDAELSLARTIQADSIPNRFPAFPDRTDFDIFASMDPAKEVGGDFYNFFLIDDDHLALAIGDVSGKGIPAALFMMVTNILISDRVRMGGEPGEILTFVNENLYAHNKADMFVTVWLGILELSTGRLTASSAGHEYPALRRAGGEFGIFRDKHGFVLGGMDGVKYKTYSLQLAPGDKLFVYTDGVPEAADEVNAMLGTERMLAALNENPDAAPEQILKNVRSAVDRFVRGAEQFDDLTMLCVEYRGGKGAEHDD